jgi:hypothetical protein
MQRFGNFFRWFTDHWMRWGIPTIVASAPTAGTWILARRREWKEARRAKTDRAVDSRVLGALQDRNLWRPPRPWTGAGDMLVRSAEIAEALSLDCDIVIDSLERLEARGRVRNAGGTLDNPAPYWHVVHRYSLVQVTDTSAGDVTPPGDPSICMALVAADNSQL